MTGALSLTREVVAEFSKIAETVSVRNDGDASAEIHRWFGRVFERYGLAETFRGRISNADQDYFKLLGDELFVTFVGFLLREKRWAILRTVITEPISIRYLRRYQGPGNVDWSFASEHLPLLMDEGAQRRRMSLHADILNDRHTTGNLAAIMPREDFMAADYLLFLLAEMGPDPTPNSSSVWRPWSALYLERAPMFLHNAESKRVVAELLKLFRISDAEEFRKRLRECAPRVGRLFSTGFCSNPLTNEEINKFATH